MKPENNVDQQLAHDHDTLVVKVRYIAARKRFTDPKASPDETLAILKARVLEFYELIEGAVDGGTKTYNFAADGIIQTDLSLTLCVLAQGKHELDLDLIERFEQG